jgi:hypothetical protein
MEPNPHDPTLPFVDPEAPSDVQDLDERVEDLSSAVRGLSQIVSAQARSHGASNGPASGGGQRFSPLVQREELGELADWVDFYCPWPVSSPRLWPPKVPTPQSGCSGFGQRRSISFLTRFLHAE